MSYILYKSNGLRLVTVEDGSINKSATDLTFVGKNYAGYGEILNQNLVKLLENFANTTAPAKPMTGQLWFNTATKKINIYDGTRFKTITTFDSADYTPPTPNVLGDFWYDSSIKKLKFHDGSKFVIIGPTTPPEFNDVQLVAETVIDSNDLEKNILKFNIDDGTGDVNVVAVVARDQFVPSSTATLYTEAGFPVVQRGITLPGATVTTGDSTGAGYYFWGTAGTALGLVEKNESVYSYYPASDYLRRVDFDAAINNGLTIPSDNGVEVGLGHTLKISADSNARQGQISAVNGESIAISLLYNSGLTNVITFTENNIVPNSSIGVNLGTTGARYANIWVNTVTSVISTATTAYANTFIGRLTGNVTGNITGNVNGAWVTATNMTVGTITATRFNGPMTGSISGNVTTSLIQATGGAELSPGQIKGQWTLIGQSTLQATYADLAERYAADALYGPATVLVLGGEKEVTITTERANVAVAGIVSTNPAYKMNSDAGTDDSHPYIALKGRVPCKVVGPIAKGELLVTSRRAGYAEAAQMGDSPNAVIGKALEDFEGLDGVIEVKI